MYSFRQTLFILLVLNCVYLSDACDLYKCGTQRRTAEHSFSKDKYVFCRSLQSYLVCLRKLSTNCIHDNHVKQVLSRYSLSCHDKKHEKKNIDIQVSYFESNKIKPAYITDDLYDDAGEKMSKRRIKQTRKDDQFDDIDEKSRKARKNQNIQRQRGIQDDLYDDFGERVTNNGNYKTVETFDDIGGDRTEKRRRKTFKKEKKGDIYDDFGDKIRNRKFDRRERDDVADDVFDDIGEGKKENRRRKTFQKEKKDDLYDDFGEKSKNRKFYRRGRDDVADDIFDDRTASQMAHRNIGRNPMFKSRWNIDEEDRRERKYSSRFGNTKIERSGDDYNDWEDDREKENFTSETHDDENDDNRDRYESTEVNDFDSFMTGDIAEDIIESSEEIDDENYDEGAKTAKLNAVYNPAIQIGNHEDDMTDYFDDINEFETDDLVKNLYLARNPLNRMLGEPVNALWYHNDDFYDENLIGFDDLEDQFYDHDFENDVFDDLNENVLNYKPVRINRQLQNTDYDSSDENLDFVKKGIQTNDNFDEFDSSEMRTRFGNKRIKSNIRDIDEYFDDIKDDFDDDDDFHEEGTRPYHYKFSSEEEPITSKQDIESDSVENAIGSESDSNEEIIPNSNFLQTLSKRRNIELKHNTDFKNLHKRRQNQYNSLLNFASNDVPLSKKLGINLDGKPKRMVLQRSEGIIPEVRKEQLFSKESIPNPTEHRRQQASFFTRGTEKLSTGPHSSSFTLKPSNIVFLLSVLLIIL